MTPASPGHDNTAAILEVHRARVARARDAVIRRWLGRGLKAIGYTLLAAAVLLVLAFVGIVVINDSMGPKCRSLQSEARGNLKALYVAQESYAAEYDVYANKAEELGFTAKGNKPRYRFFVEGSGKHFTGVAVGVRDDVAGDIWTVTEKNDLTNVKNGCW